MTPRFFMERPILSGVISIFFILLGIIGIYHMPVEQFPEIAPPTIRITASFTGANAETLMKSVVAPLEEAINGVENMAYMSSSASNNGTATINCFFRLGTDPDMAMVNVQNRVASAQGALPADVVRNGIAVRKSQTSTAKIISLMSPDGSYDQNYLSNYFKINIGPRLARIPGVGELTIFGTDYAIRIWLKPDKMAAYGIVPEDIEAVLKAQNSESPTGTLGENTGNTFQYVLRYHGRYEKPEEFSEMVIKSLPDGEIVRLRDVAEIELGASSYDRINELTGKPGVNCMISQSPGANAHEIIARVDQITSEVAASLPEGMELVDLMSVKSFLDASIKSVLHTLVEAFVLVTLVVLLFLRNWRATLIPAVAIIVSLLGTFAFLWMIGFSINLLTLFALVLVIGTVVDDAVVVVEAVQARFDRGDRDSYQASAGAMQGLVSALVTTSLVFMSVFIPVCFMGGATGKFYTQFGVTMAVAVLISVINALTLTPALCVLLMRPSTGGRCIQTPSLGGFTAGVHRLAVCYRGILALLIRTRWLLVVVVLSSVVALAWLVQDTPTGLIPDEDTGTIVVDVQTAPGSSLEQTKKVMARVEERLKSVSQIQLYSKSVGMNMLAGQGPSNGTFIIRLRHWDERPEEQDSNKAVIASLYDRMQDITEARILIFAQPVIAGYGVTNGFQLHVQDRLGGDILSLQKVADELMVALAHRPEIARAQSNFDAHYPQFEVMVDTALCLRHGISPQAVLDTLATYVGGKYSSDINRFSRLYRVMLQAPPSDRTDESALDRMMVRSDYGEMVPLSRYVRLKRVYGADFLSRFNLFSSITINGMPAKGYSSGQAIEAIEEVARHVLPSGYSYEFGGITREEAEQGGNPWLIFAICLIFIYLLLCGLYESLFIPFAILLTVPIGLSGIFFFARCFGLENNIYMQTGAIMLIGLLCKTAILITEYAVMARKKGYSLIRSALEAAHVRLRPILMTSLTMLIGLLPMAFATGAGANGNRSLAVGVIGGMITGTIGILIVTPILFIVFQSFADFFQKR